MTYTRPTASDPGTGGGPTDATVIIDALSDGLEAVEAAAAATHEPMGIAVKDDVSLSFDQGTRVVTVAPAVSSFDYWLNGTKVTVSAPKTVTLPNTTATHFVYFDDATGTLKQSTTAWDIASTVQVAAIYWNATTGAGVMLDERHGISMDWATHLRLHTVDGTRVVSGFAMSSYTLQPAAPANTDNDYAVASGVIADEDLRSTVPALTPGASAYRVWHRSGASGEWTWDTTSLPFTVGTTYLHWNEWTGATWQKTEAVNGRFVNFWVCATPALTAAHGVIVVMGQASHSSLALAQGESIAASIAWGTLPFTELAPLYRVTMRTNTAYNSATGRPRCPRSQRPRPARSRPAPSPGRRCCPSPPPAPRSRCAPPQESPSRPRPCQERRSPRARRSVPPSSPPPLTARRSPRAPSRA